MSELVIWTYDWVPQGPRGFVRDLRLRWACEEAGLAYAIRTVPFDGRQTNHLARQPFGHIQPAKILREMATAGWKQKQPYDGHKRHWHQRKGGFGIRRWLSKIRSDPDRPLDIRG